LRAAGRSRSGKIAGKGGLFYAVGMKRIDARTIRETDTRDGKVTDLAVYKASADGRTMHVVDDDILHGTKLTYTADKKAM
jgi:hypothetical protein